MKKMILTMVICLIGLSGVSQNLIQPYQIRMDTNSFPVMTLSGCTNLQQAFKFIDANWHTKGGYGTTNWVNGWTNTLNTLSNNVAASISNHNAFVSNAVASVIVITNYFLATNTVQVITGSGVPQTMSASGEISDTANMNNNGTITIPTSGVYRIGCRADFSHQNQTTSNPRMIMKLYKGASEYSTMHRHQLQDAGVETVISSDIVIKALTGESYSICVVTDGSMYATNAIGAIRLWAVQERY